MKAWSCALSLVLSIGLSSSVVLAQGESKKSCGPGRRPGINGCVDASPKARLKQEPVKAATPPPAPTPEHGMRLPPDERSPAEMAEQLLLTRELALLENLLERTPQGAPERAALLKRLADTYADLAKRAEHVREVARLRAERAEQAEKATPKPRRPRRPTVL